MHFPQLHSPWSAQIFLSCLGQLKLSHSQNSPEICSSGFWGYYFRMKKKVAENTDLWKHSHRPQLQTPRPSQMADSLVLKTSFSTTGNWARNVPLALLVQRGSAHSRSITLAIFSNISVLASTHTTDHVASMTVGRVFDDSFFLGALAIAKDFNVDDQGLIQTRRSNPQDEITLVDAVGCLKAKSSSFSHSSDSYLQSDFERDFISDTNAVTDVGILKGRSIETHGAVRQLEAVAGVRVVDHDDFLSDLRFASSRKKPLFQIKPSCTPSQSARRCSWSHSPKFRQRRKRQEGLQRAISNFFKWFERNSST